MTERKQEIVENKQSEDGHVRELRIDLHGHVPFNKRSWEAHPKTRAILRVNLRPATPEDQARVICFLASSDADFVTGVTIDVTGGQ